MSNPKLALSEVAAVYWPVLVISFLVSFLATPLCRKLALKWNIVDRPNDFLKPHKHPIPYLGGVAIFLGCAAGIILALGLFGHTTPPDSTGTGMNTTPPGPVLDPLTTWGILGCVMGIMVLGLLDDLHVVSPRTKLTAIAVVTIVLVLFKVGDDSILIFVRGAGLPREDFSDALILLYSLPVTLLITIAACNATNLIDGVDGLCSGVMGIIAGGFLVLAVHMHLYSEWHPLDAQRVILCLAMMGAALGFLPHNRNPAKIFMGDAGSMQLGLIAAILLLLFCKSNAIRWLLASLMVFALPLADMAMAMVRRWRYEKPIMQGDRSHFYDQLLDRGWPVRKVVTVSYMLTIGFAFLGCVSILLRTRFILLLYALVLVILLVVIRKFGMLKMGPKRSASP